MKKLDNSVELYERKKEMSNHKCIGDKNNFAIQYIFLQESHETILFMYVNGRNILEFKRCEKILTTKWNIDDLVLWLRTFIDEVEEETFPFECEGTFAADKDDKVRDFDTDDDEIFEKHYQQLYEWERKHRWHSVSNGAILADVFFQKINDMVEISWDNRSEYSDIEFSEMIGGAYVPIDYFNKIINEFLRDYANYWYPYIEE